MCIYIYTHRYTLSRGNGRENGNYYNGRCPAYFKDGIASAKHGVKEREKNSKQLFSSGSTSDLGKEMKHRDHGLP